MHNRIIWQLLACYVKHLILVLVSGYFGCFKHIAVMRYLPFLNLVSIFGQDDFLKLTYFIKE